MISPSHATLSCLHHMFGFLKTIFSLSNLFSNPIFRLFFFILQPLERRCSLTRGVRESARFIYLTRLHSRTLWKRLMETGLNFESHNENEPVSPSQRAHFLQINDLNRNFVWQSAFTSNSSHTKAAVFRWGQFSNYSL